MNVRHQFAAVASLVALFVAPPRARAQDTVITQPLTLGDAARLASHRNVNAETAHYRADAASARVTQERAALLPNIAGTASQNGRSFNSATFGFPIPGFDPRGEVIGPVNTYDIRGHLSQTLLDIGAIKRVGSAKTAADASASSAQDAAESAAQLAAAAYLRTQQAKGLLVARTADSVLADSLLGIANDQLKAGVGVALDVTRARSQVASVRAQLIATRNDYALARVDLLRALNLPLSTPVQLADSLGSLPVADTVPDESQAIARAVAERPDLRAAEQQLMAAQQSVSATKAELIPSIGAFGDQGWSAQNGGSVLPTYDWGVQLSWPVFDGGRRNGRIEEGEAQAREVDAQLRDLRERAASEVRSALLDLASARELLDAARERVTLAEQEVGQARDRFRAGVAGNADVFTASLTLNSSRSDFVNALAAYQTARVELARAQGSVTSLP